MSRTTQNVYGAGPARIGGPARNLPSGPVRYGVPANSIGARELAPNAVQAGDIATSALGRCRYAAFSGLGAASTAGDFASLNYTPSSNFTAQIVLASSVAPSAACVVLGRASASRFNVQIDTNGTIRARNNAVDLAVSASGAFKFDGLAHQLVFAVTSTSLTVHVDGVLVASGSYAAITWTLGSYSIGGGSSASSQRWPGSIQLVELLDNVTPANSIRLLMDEPSGNYANTYPGSTAAASATRNGYVSTVPVLSLDGRGMPWQGAPSPLVYEAIRSNTDQVMDGSVAADYALTYSSETSDPTSSLNHTTGLWTASCAGLAVVTGQTRITATGLTDAIDFSVRLNGSNNRARTYSATVAGTPMEIFTAVTISVAAGNTIDLAILSIANTNTTFAVDFSTFRVEFYPTPTIG